MRKSQIPQITCVAVLCVADGCGRVTSPTAMGDASPMDAACSDAYRQAVMADSPLAYFPLDDARGASQAADLSGNHRDGTYMGSPMLQSTGSLPSSCGSSAAFDGDDFVQAALPTINARAGEYVTVELWMNWDGAEQKMPVAFGTYDLTVDGMDFGFNTNRGDLWGVSRGDLSHRWVHVVAAFNNGSTKDNVLYIDGVKQDLHELWDPTQNTSVTAAFYIGRYGSDEEQGYKFTGAIDEVSVYNRLLPAERVGAHFEASRH